MKCPDCKGTGKVTIQVHEVPSEGPVVHSSFEMDCFLCHGTGEATDADIQHKADMDAIWCRCGNPSGKTRFFRQRDGTHGWECCDCGKVTQIG